MDPKFVIKVPTKLFNEEQLYELVSEKSYDDLTWKEKEYWRNEQFYYRDSDDNYIP